MPLLSIAENIFLGNEIARRGVIDWLETWRRTEELLDKVGLDDAPQTRVDQLGVGRQQLVEIAKALSKKVKLLILDEPTSALQENDSEKLLALLLEFKAQGITSILISHKLNEISQVADRITVLRDGTAVSTLEAGGRHVSEDAIIRDMVGRDMAHRYPDRTPEHRRGADGGQRLERLPPAPFRPAGHQGRQPDCPRGRGRRASPA